MLEYITIVGYPRSGTTWLARMTSDLFSASMGAYVGPGPNIYPDQFRKNLRGTNKMIRVLRTHNTIDEHYPNGLMPWDRTIFIIRDIRDIVVSFKHFAKLASYERSYDVLQSRCNWSEYVDNWRNCCDIIIKYENLHENTEIILESVFPDIQVSYGTWGLFIEKHNLHSIQQALPDVVWKGKTGLYKEELDSDLIDKITLDHKKILGELDYE